MLMKIAYPNYLPDVLHQTPVEFEQQAKNGNGSKTL